MSESQWRLGDRFELFGQVGTGAAGTVWRGRELPDGAECAIKLLRLELVADHDAVNELYATLNAVARLGHPGIAAVDDVVSGDGYFALRSRLVPGENLRSLVSRQGAMAPEAAAQLMAQLCDALAAAHEIGITHGDLHPDNVLVTQGADGLPQAVLTDFGMAPLVNRTAPYGGGSKVPAARYQAPEIVAGTPAGAAADVYAVGVLLSEIVAGREPFTTQWPPLLACLDRDPRFRPSAGQFAATLREATAPTQTAYAQPAYGSLPPGYDGMPSTAGSGGGDGRTSRFFADHKTESGIAAAVMVVGILIGAAFALVGGGSGAAAAGSTGTTTAAPSPAGSSAQSVVLPPVQSPAASPSPSPSASSAVALGQLTLVNAQSDTCLDTAGRIFANGTTEDIYSCNGTPAQVWNLTAAGQLSQDGDAYCLDDAGFGDTPGTKVVLWSCNGGANQQWAIQPDGSVQGVSSHLCLDIDGQGSNTDDGTALVLWTCDGKQSQQWSRR